MSGETHSGKKEIPVGSGWDDSAGFVQAIVGHCVDELGYDGSDPKRIAEVILVLADILVQRGEHSYEDVALMYEKTAGWLRTYERMRVQGTESEKALASEIAAPPRPAPRESLPVERGFAELYSRRLEELLEHNDEGRYYLTVDPPLKNDCRYGVLTKEIFDWLSARLDTLECFGFGLEAVGQNLYFSAPYEYVLALVTGTPTTWAKIDDPEESNPAAWAVYTLDSFLEQTIDSDMRSGGGNFDEILLIDALEEWKLEAMLRHLNKG